MAAHVADLELMPAELAASPLLAWSLGAGLLLMGSVIVAFHQSWRGAAGIIISLLGWLLAVPGVVLLLFPKVDVAADALTGQVAHAIARSLFLCLSLAGLYLTAVGWYVEPRRPRLARTAASSPRSLTTNTTQTPRPRRGD